MIPKSHLPIRNSLIFIFLWLFSAIGLNAQTTIQITADSTNLSWPCPTPVNFGLYIDGSVTNNNINSDSVYLIINWGDGTSTFDSVGLNSSMWINANFTHSYSIPGTFSPEIIGITSNGVSDTNTIASPFTIYSTCAQITGYTYVDSNANCIYDFTDSIVPYRSIIVKSSSGVVIAHGNSSVTGYYSLDVPFGLSNLEISVSSTYSANALSISCPTSGSYTFNSFSNQNFDFAFECNSSLKSKNLNTWGWLSPPGGNSGFMSITLHVEQCGQAITTPDTLVAVIPHQAQFIGMDTVYYNGNFVTYPLPNTINGDTLTWYFNQSNNYSNYTIGYFHYVRLKLATDTSATIFDSAYFYAATDTHNLVITNTNLVTTEADFTNLIGGPYDPNNKISYPQGVGTNGYIDTNTLFLTYEVNFQNTGTAPAVNVYVIDSLSEHLDWSSVQILSESHPMKLIQYDENKLKFQFSNINLPDSNANEPESHGSFMYRVKLKDNLPVGTAIENTAHIFFDYNEPIVTNTTINTIHDFPVPPTPLAIDLVGRNVTCLGNDNGRIDLAILSGNEPYTINWSTGENTMSISALSAASYSVTVTDSENHTETQSLEIIEDRMHEAPTLGAVNGNLQAQSWASFIYSIQSTAGSEYEWNALGGEVLSSANASAEIRWFAGPEGEVIVTEKDINGCTATDSIPVGITFLGTSELNIEGVKVYPNPTSEFLNIELENVSDKSSLMLFDAMGRLVLSKSVKNNVSKVDVSNLPKGTYTLHLNSDNGENSIQIMVN